MLEQQCHPFLAFDEECNAVPHLRAIEKLVNEHILDSIVVEELDFFISKEISYPQLNPKVLYDGNRLCIA